MKGTWMAAGVLALAGVAAPRAADADTRVVVGHRSHRHDAHRIGFDNGYRDGLRHGRKDGRHHEDYNFWHDQRYRRGDHGYRRWHGSRHAYIDGYRQGYRSGYRDAYARERHRHRGRDGWCYDRHDRAVPRGQGRDRDGDRYRYDDDDYDHDDDGRIIYEEPPRRRW